MKYLILTLGACAVLSGCSTLNGTSTKSASVANTTGFIGNMLNSNAVGQVTGVVSKLAGVDEASLVKTATENYKKVVQEARDNKTLDENSATQKRILKVFKQLQPHVKQMNETAEGFNWELAVLKSDQQNAIISSGGKAVFYTGLVEKLALTDDEIAALMAHEMIHLIEGHAKYKMGGKALTNLATKAGKAYVGETVFNLGKSYMESSFNRLGDSAIEFGLQMGVNNPYNIELETTADEQGLILLAKSGYNPKAALTLWDKLKAIDPKVVKQSFVAAHPLNQKRRAVLEKQMETAMEMYQSLKTAKNTKK